MADGVGAAGLGVHAVTAEDLDNLPDVGSDIIL
jgi:hypothetical protein